ncbi:hypothetical protein DOM21_07160 [Bacteriovorax stolpii]|uniref:DUF2130 domain-containing protein n=1 Tax=Bacteriovorax stolpii TaxID=960 RepID=UPI001158A38A|nr:DUF2130 domain-containing protein [Bacteriovorax stolpii]QDK41238.1 hypothetical protein DOM21_07160 [Bacteriovorax stolpii]
MKIITTKCPSCSHQFSLDQVLSKEIDNIVSSETKEIVEKREIEIRNLKIQLEEIDSLNKIESQKIIQEEVKKAIQVKEKQLKAENKISIDAKEEELKQLIGRLTEAQKNEVLLRKKMFEVEQREKEIELVVERKTAEKVNNEKEKIANKISEEFYRKDIERERLIADLRKQVIEMKHKTEEGSQQVRGETFEEEISLKLKDSFPTDIIEDVPKGVSGADILQTAISKNGSRVGKILWEIKQTKSFQPVWIEKLKEDRNKIGAEMAILVTETMPKGKSGAYLDQGVWIVDPAAAINVAKVARQGLVDVHQALSVSAVRHEKADVLYSYLTNPLFKQRLEAIVESFHQMREDLEREKRAISKGWKQRERLIDSVVDNTVYIYSDIQGVVGHKILNIQRLELHDSLDSI